MKGAPARQKSNIAPSVSTSRTPNVFIVIRRHIHRGVHCCLDGIRSEQDTRVGSDSSPDVNIQCI